MSPWKNTLEFLRKKKKKKSGPREKEKKKWKSKLEEFWSQEVRMKFELFLKIEILKNKILNWVEKTAKKKKRMNKKKKICLRYFAIFRITRRAKGKL